MLAERSRPASLLIHPLDTHDSAAGSALFSLSGSVIEFLREGPEPHSERVPPGEPPATCSSASRLL
jgi:hypothetical protein